MIKYDIIMILYLNSFYIFLNIFCTKCNICVSFIFFYTSTPSLNCVGFYKYKKKTIIEISLKKTVQSQF